MPQECNHPHLLFRKVGTQKVGRYQTALDIVEGMLKCMNPQYFKVSVDDEWNVTITTQNVWVMVATPVVQGLGWITSENKIRQSDLYGLKIHSSSKAMPELEYQWCILPRRSSFAFSGTFLIPSSVSLCQCRHKVVQVQTSLIGPLQVGEKRLQVWHEMVPHGLFRETLMKEPGRINYFASGVLRVTLHFRRRAIL